MPNRERESAVVLPPPAPSLSALDELAKVYASNYASPHHFTLSVEGLRNLIAELPGAASPAVPPPALPDGLEAARDGLMALSISSPQQSALAALANLIGTPDDPNIGWRGTSSAPLILACEFCGEEHEDCTKIAHAKRCPVPAAFSAFAALAAASPSPQDAPSERERCAKLCEELACMVDDGAGAVGRLWQAARNIREGKQPGNFYPGRTEPLKPRDPDWEARELREALEDIALMDPKGERADDLGRAARIARAAIASKGTP